MAEISIIVPIYNVERYIRRALASLVGQTMRDIEIICVDDCGTDASMSVVRELACTDDRIKIVKNSHNLDIADTRNAGLAAAQSPYIMWCDPDDWFDENMCRKMYDAIRENKSDIAMCATNVIYEADSVVSGSDTLYFAVPGNKTVNVSDEITATTNVCVWNKIFRRDIIDTYNIHFPSKLRYEDEFFFRAYMCHAKRITFITDKLYNYRRNSGSIMNKTFNKTAKYATDALMVAIEFQKYLNDQNLYDAKYEAFWGAAFPSCFRSTWLRTGTTTDMQRIFNIAISFINEKYTRPSDNAQTRRMVNMILHRAYTPVYINVFFGIIKYINNENKCEFKIGPLSIYKSKRAHDAVTVYIIGLPVIKKKASI